MNNSPPQIDDELIPLWEQLKKLHFQLRDCTSSKYKRVNPFNEDLFEWEEKGEYFNSEGTRIYDSATIMGDVKFGKNCWVGPFVMLDGTGGLTIGDWVDFSSGVKIFSHDTVKRALTGGKHPTEYAPVGIGSNCFIGTDTVILKGVNIGNHSVIAANSLVNKSFTDYSIVGGMPARKIGTVEIENDNVHLNYENEE
jgi:acetyltransferase-like isoleucine patch superfamily enzyme